MSDKIFDLDAGDICLDFANTANWHASEHPEESLHDFSDLLVWGEAAGILSPKSIEQLSYYAQQHSVDAKKAFQRAIHTRETIYHIFSCRYAGRPVAISDLAYLNALVSEAASHRKLVPNDDHFQWEWKHDEEDINLILWVVASAAAGLLTSEKISRVRECEDDRGCGYLFIDQSKNHSRRWCSMESCGNRAKAQRHYSRSKGE